MSTSADEAASLWHKDGGVYFGFGVTPTKADPYRSILEEPWEIERARELRYPPRPTDSGDRHLVTIGPNGSGKTRRLLIPNLLRLTNWSAVVIDIKGELAAYTATHRAAAGQEIVVIDPFEVLKASYRSLFEKHSFLASAGYNPVAALDPDDDEFPDDALTIAEAIIKIQGQDPHWTESAQELVAALIMYVRLTKEGSGSLADVRGYLGQKAEDFRAIAVEMALAANEHNCPELGARAARFQELTGENKELNGIISAALTQTRWLDSRPIKRDLSKGDFKFESLKDTPKTVYLVLPPRHIVKHATWLRVMITSILLPLMRSLDGARSPVLFMLDEFAQLGHLPIIEDNMAMLRGYGVKLWTVFQDLAQAKSIYKDRWESFISNAGIVHSFAPQDVTTRDYLSKLSGQRLYWINTGSTSDSHTKAREMSRNTGTSEITQYMPGPFYWPQGLGRMDIGEAVLFSRGNSVRSLLPDPEDKGDALRLRDQMRAAHDEFSGRSV